MKSLYERINDVIGASTDADCSHNGRSDHDCLVGERKCCGAVRNCALVCAYFNWTEERLARGHALPALREILPDETDDRLQEIAATVVSALEAS
jgi:hypothetical protein